MSFEAKSTSHAKHRNAADKKAEEWLRCKGESREHSAGLLGRIVWMSQVRHKEFPPMV
jgi:hypothetical protein